MTENQILIEDLIRSRDGDSIKSASAEGTSYIRTRIREEGLLRKIVPPVQKNDSDLTPALNHDFPQIIEYKQIETPGARTIPFGTSMAADTYYSNKFAVVFNHIDTREYRKDVNELRAIKNFDIRKMVTDQSLMDISITEDGTAFNEFQEIVGTVGGVGASGHPQSFLISGTLDKRNHQKIISTMEDFRLNVGCLVMNRKTAKAFTLLKNDDFGYNLAEETFKKGVAGLGDATIGGVKHIFTMKREIVPDGVVWAFAEPDYFARFYTLEDPTIFVERKKHDISWYCTQTQGFTVANVAGVLKFQFTDFNL